MKARLEINTWRGQAGAEVEVDETDPEVRALVQGGLLTPVEQRTQLFCLMCDPPSFHDSATGLAAHQASVHEGEGAG